MTTTGAVPDLVALRELQSRALEMVARRCAQQTTGAGDAWSRAALRQVVTALDVLAEVARHAASAAAAAPAPWTDAVETADALSTTAQALRMLAELELGAIPGP